MKRYVALILEKDGKFLVERRKKSKKIHADKIVFPAGRIEDGETREQALKREIKEELDIEISGLFPVHEDIIDVEERQVVYWYGCESFTGNIKNIEAEELIWIGLDELEKLSFQNSRDALEAYIKIKFKKGKP